MKSELVREAIAGDALTGIRNTHFSVKLTFTMPQQTKLDRSAQAEVEHSRNATNGYKVRKRLWAKETIDPFNSLAAAARNYLRARTVPMGDTMLLPKTLMFDVLDVLENNYFVQWDQLKTVFAQDYVGAIRAAESAQGTGFDPSVYPDVSSITSQFTRTLDLSPVGNMDAAIFDDLEDAQANEIAQRVQATTMRSIESALSDPLARLLDAVMNIHNKTSRDKSRIHPSMMGELEEITALIPALNVVNVPALNELAAKCREQLLTEDALGTGTTKREEVAEASDEILKGLGVNTVNNVNNNDATARKQAAKDAAASILSQMKGIL
jgi:hypothetical protein